jgi:electron transport complex protein RnfG
MSDLHEKQYSIFQIAMNLAGACLISGIIIAGTYFVTAPVAAINAEKLKNDAMKELVKGADEFVPIKGKSEWFEAQKDGKVIAYVVENHAKGFGGHIKMLVAVSTDSKVIDYSILSHNETPGLGDVAGEEPFKGQFKGKSAEALEVVKDPSKTENIQALTGATISSRAVTAGVKEVVEKVEQHIGGK